MLYFKIYVLYIQEQCKSGAPVSMYVITDPLAGGSIRNHGNEANSVRKSGLSTAGGSPYVRLSSTN